MPKFELYPRRCPLLDAQHAVTAPDGTRTVFETSGLTQTIRDGETTAARIAERVSAGKQSGELRADLGEAEAWAIMGMNVFLGLRYALWEQDVSFDDIVETLSDLFRNGLTLDGKEKP